MSSTDSKIYPGIARERGTFGTPDPNDPAKLIVTTSDPATYIRQVEVAEVFDGRGQCHAAVWNGRSSSIAVKRSREVIQIAIVSIGRFVQSPETRQILLRLPCPKLASSSAS
jgi:hypothetical protein